MKTEITVGLIGDFDSTVPAHRAIPVALRWSAEATGVDVRHEWLATESIVSEPHLAFDALWCVPASPYCSMDGALLAIRHARENDIPFVGTCGGFQHAIVEFARNMLGWRDADHAETSPGAARAVITPLACALVEATDTVRLRPGSRIAAAYGALQAVEGYHCRYGLNAQFQHALLAGPLRATAHDDSGEVRAVELDDHRFFVATLFQPERAALQGRPAPLIAAFVRAAAGPADERATSSTARRPER
jgi:CTP synthase (UTP-ammonia lyase)